MDVIQNDMWERFCRNTTKIKSTVTKTGAHNTDAFLTCQILYIFCEFYNFNLLNFIVKKIYTVV